jgi:hypothetical protein
VCEESTIHISVSKQNRLRKKKKRIRKKEKKEKKKTKKMNES